MAFNRVCAGLLLAVALLGCCSAAQLTWDDADAVLYGHIAKKSFPGCVALVADKTGILHHKAYGNFTYGLPPPYNHGRNPPMELDTMFDMASCTKVAATTTAVAQFYQRGEIDLSATVVSILGDSFGLYGKQDMTVTNLLLHNSGFDADPEPFWNTKAFGCPETNHTHPSLTFSCMDQIWESVTHQKLIAGIGASYLYSDLNFITLMFVVGELARTHNHVHPSLLLSSCAGAPPSSPLSRQCYFEAYVRIHVVSKADMRSSGFLPHGPVLEKCAPTCNDTEYMHTTIQGAVEDGNTYAMGGISGHAGFFSTALDMYKLASLIMWPTHDSTFMNATTARHFTTEYNHTQSSRALGWNMNDHTVEDQGFSQSCGSLSEHTWMHDGYTGTMICGDQDRELIVILLTNRVYPDPSNTSIMSARKDFTSTVQKLFDQMHPPTKE